MDLGTILASFLVPFGIHFRYFFGIDFWMFFLMPFFDFWAKMVAKRLPNFFRRSQGESLFGTFWHTFPILFRHRFLDGFFNAFFQLLGENGRQTGPKKNKTFPTLGTPGRSKNAPKTHPRRNLDFSPILHRLWHPFW